MASLAPLLPRTVSIDDFVALTDEIAALARAGVPLSRGLLELGSDLPGRLGQLVHVVGQRLERGETLEQIVAQSPELFPPAYRAVIAAGAKVGRLPAALERVSQSARRTSQLQQSFALAMFYPTVLLFVAYVLILFWFDKLLPTLATVFDDFVPASRPFWEAALAFREHMWWWGPLLILLVALWWIWFWWRSSRAASGLELHPMLCWGAIGTLVKMRRAGRLAALADTLAMLVEYGVPLPEGLKLAAETTSDRRLIAAAGELAEGLNRGESRRNPGGFPPLLAWAIASGQVQAELPHILRRMAAAYQDEAARHAQWMSLTRPIFLTAVLGGATVILFALLHFGPFIMLLYQLAEAQTR